MATNFPGSLDTSTQQPSPSSSTEMDDVGYEHDVVHTNHSGAIIALETKLGTGASNAASASDGHVLTANGSGGSAWEAAAGGASISISDTAPGSPSAGDLWYESDTGKTFVYYADGSSNQWVEIGASSAAAAGATGQVQYASSGAFASSANFTYDGSTTFVITGGKVGIGDASPARTFQVTESDSGVTPSVSHHVLFESSDDMGVLIASGTTKNGYLRFGDSGSSASGGLNYDHNNNTMRIRTNGTDSVYMASTGYVGFNVSSPTVRIHLAGGSASATNSGIAAAWDTHSSVRWKTDVADIANAVNTVKQLRPVTFKYKDPETQEVSDMTEIGFIAEELRDHVPSVVRNEEKDPADNDNLHLMDNGEPYGKGVDYGRLSSLSIAALQELITRVEALEGA